MNIGAKKPLGCRAEAIGHMVPAPSNVYRKVGNVMIICGDRRLDFPASSNHAQGIEYDFNIVAREQLAELASELICGFCVGCPNRLASVPDIE